MPQVATIIRPRATASCRSRRWNAQMAIPATAAYVTPGQVSSDERGRDLRDGGQRVQRWGDPAGVQGLDGAEGEGEPGPTDQGHQQRGRDQDRGLGRRSADHSGPIMARPITRNRGRVPEPRHMRSPGVARVALATLDRVIDVKVLRTDPDRVRASQRARGESVALVDDLVAADQARRDTIAAYEELRAEQKELGKQLARAQGEERRRLLARTKELADLVKKADAAQSEVARRLRRRCSGRSATWSSPTSRPAARTTTSCSRPSAPRGTSRRRASPRATTWSWARCSGRSTWSAGRRCPAPGSTT